jgi:hypothetical protein
MGPYTICILCLAAVGVGQTMKLAVPDGPAPGTQVLSGSFQGYSMEMASFPNMAGNLT